MRSIFITVSQVLILVLEIGVGYVMAKKGKIPASALGIMNFLCTHIALPCSIVLAAAGLDSSPAVWRGMSAGLAIILVSSIAQILGCFFLFRHTEKRKRAVYQMATVYGNSAYMGIPVVAAVVGEQAIIYVTLMVIVDTICLFTHASLAMTGKKPTMKFILSKVFGLVTLSLIAGLAISLTEIQIPTILRTAMTDFRGMLTPLAMLIVGTQLAQQDLAGIFKKKEYYAVAGIKLLIWPALIMLALLPLKAWVSSAILGAIIICKGTPQAAVLGVLADSNGLDGETAAGVIGLTTLLSVLTLPLIAGCYSMFF